MNRDTSTHFSFAGYLSIPLIFLLLVGFSSLSAAANIITVAGNGSSDFAGEGGPATSAALGSPRGITFDGDGNLYLTAGGTRVLKVDAASRLITTVAGNGSYGFSGDGGAATVAQLNLPTALHIDSNGYLYIADSTNNRIRWVSPAGDISTFYGSDSTDHLSGIGDFLYDSGGNLFISDTGNHRILVIPPTGGTLRYAGGAELGFANRGYSGDGGKADAARLFSPRGLALDSQGNLYVSEGQNHVVRKIERATNIITTIAGTGTFGFSGDLGSAAQAQLNTPEGLAIDSNDNLYIADAGNNRIRRIESATGIITTITGTGSAAFSGDYGPAEYASLSYPVDVYIDGNDNLFISDTNNHRIRKISATDNTPPTGTITINNGAEFTNQMAVTLSLTCDDGGGSGCGQMRFRTGSGAYGGFVSFADTHALNPFITEGSQDISVQFADRDGNLSDAFTATITLDLTSPAEPTVLTPTSGAVTSATPTLTGTVEAYATVEINNAAGQILTTTTADGSGNWSKTVGPLPQGVNTMRIYARDRAGNRSIFYAQLAVNVDSVPPNTPVITSPADGTSTAETSLTVSGTEARTSSDASLSKVSTISLYDKNTLIGTATAIPQSSSVSNWSIATGVLPVGIHSFTVTATDDIGNVSAPSQAVSVTITGPDTTPPQVTPPADIVVPASGSYGTYPNMGEIPNFLSGAVAEDNLDGPLTPTHDAPSPLPLGTTTVTFTATDAAGNVGTATATITVTDQTPPVIYLPADPVVTAKSATGIYFLSVPGFNASQTYAMDNVDGHMTIQNGLLTHDAPDFLPIGTTTVTFSATDKAGKTAQSSLTITVVHPRVTPSAQGNGTITPDTPQEVVYGNQTTFTITANDGYIARVGGTCGGTLVGTTYTTQKVYADCTVEAAFSNDHLVTPSPPPVNSLIACYNHVLAVKGDGTVTAWGDNYGGQATVPDGLTDVAGVAAGFYHSLAVKKDGTVVAWGTESGGSTAVPDGLTDVIAVAAGNSHALALKKDGTVVAWGNNSSGQAAVPAGLADVMAVAAGSLHSLALRRDGTVVAWGQSNYLQTNVPAGLSDVVAVAAGNRHSLALKKNGTVVGWGNNSLDQISIPTSLTEVVAIASGLNHALALRADGTVVAWGADTNGQATVPENLSGIVAVAAGSSLSLALKNDGTLVAWGLNTSGQATVPSPLTLLPFHGAQGMISPNIQQMVPHGAVLHFTILPNPGYGASMTGSCGGSLVGNIYTTNPVTADCAVGVTFVMPGDFNGDNVLNLADAILGMAVLAGSGENAAATADIDGDGRASVADVIFLLREIGK